MAKPSELRPVPASVWRSCAGTSVKIPAVNSRVYYFPQGHAEQSSSPPSLSPLVSFLPMLPCHVTAVVLLANPDTDEVFARIRLLPVLPHSPSSADVAVADEVEADGGGHTVSFAKVLTPSDANNGGGFSVPRFCADSIFPPLNFAADPPVQNILVRDVHGVVWEFRHIYRGTPRRHLLTTGWSKFVNSKKLIAGDSVVFMRKTSTGELSVGVRRAVRANADCSGRWNLPSKEVVGGDLVAAEGSWRSGRGRVTAESVCEAAEMAARGMAFEVVYYPRAGWADFVVSAETVEESLNMYWNTGMKVKMAMETEDSSRVTWFQGTVSEAVVPDSGPWRGSPWKMLQVEWDEHEFLQNVKRVSPWQVEHVLPPSPLHPTFHSAKKSRINQNSGLSINGVEDLSFPIMGLTDSITGNVKPSLMSHYSLPAGMQGARQSQFFVSNLSNLISENTPQIYGPNLFGNTTPPTLKTASAEQPELNNHSSQSEILSSDSQSSVYLFGTELAGKQGCISPTKAGLHSFQLFGKTIHVKHSAESNCVEDYAHGNRNTLPEEVESVKKPLGLPFKNLLDVRSQSTPAVDSCPL